MALGFIVALRNNRLDEITALIDAGPGAGLVRIYDGVRPATGGPATNLLAELPLNDPSFPAAAAGAMGANGLPITDPDAAAGGTATWFRIVDSTGAAVIDGDVGTSGSDLNLNTTTITIGVQVQITQLDLTDGNP